MVLLDVLVGGGVGDVIVAGIDDAGVDGVDGLVESGVFRSVEVGPGAKVVGAFGDHGCTGCVESLVDCNVAVGDKPFLDAFDAGCH